VLGSESPDHPESLAVGQSQEAQKVERVFIIIMITKLTSTMILSTDSHNVKPVFTRLESCRYNQH